MIILGILKVIGILLLVLLGILLLLILLLLFCPVRYQGAAKKEDGQQLIASADITWLLHFFHLRVTIEGTQPEVSVRVFGISTESIGKVVSVFRRKPKTPKTEPDRSIEDVDRTTSAKRENFADSNERAVQKKLSVDSKAQSAENEETITAENKKSSSQNKIATLSIDSRKNASEKETITDVGRKTNENHRNDFSDKIKGIIKQIKNMVRKLLDILKRMFHFPEHLAASINKGVSKGKAAAKKTSALKAFVSTQEVKEALAFGLNRTMRLFRHFRPTKLSGEVEFGFPDPADTGMALAVAAPFYPYYADHLQVTPDFQEKRLSFSLKFKGRLYGCMLLFVAVQILLDNNIRKVIGKIRKRRSE